MEFGPVIKNPVFDINKLVRQGTMLNQTVQTVEGDSTADQATTDLLAKKDPVIHEIAVGMSGEEASLYTVSGTPPLSLPNSLGKPLKAWSVDVLPYQEGTGDPAPDNVRPIHGTDKVTITTAGKNLLNKANFEAETGNTTVTETTTGIKVASTDIGPYRRAINTNVVDYATVAGKAITLYYYNTNLNGGIARFRIALYKQNGTMLQSLIENAQSTDGYVTRTITVPDNVADAYSLGVVLYANSADAIGASVEYSNLQLELGSTATPYTPYLAPSQTVLTLPSTVYTASIGSSGGESRTAKKILTGTETITVTDDGMSTMMFVVLAIDVIRRADATIPMHCSHYKYVPWNSSPWAVDMSVSYYQTNQLRIKDNRFATIEEFKTYLSDQYTNGTPVEVEYQIITPQTFPITSPTIPTPTGTATTWATAEDGTVDSMGVTYVGKA